MAIRALETVIALAHAPTAIARTSVDRGFHAPLLVPLMMIVTRVVRAESAGLSNAQAMANAVRIAPRTTIAMERTARRVM